MKDKKQENIDNSFKVKLDAKKLAAKLLEQQQRQLETKDEQIRALTEAIAALSKADAPASTIKDALRAEAMAALSDSPNVTFIKQALHTLEQTKAKEHALSQTYLRHSKRNNNKLKINLFICTGTFFGISWKFPQMNLSIISLMLLGLISLLIAKEQLLEYRIRKGLFGTNRTEARTLIEFIIKNSDDIDFTDSKGNLRRALMPETEPTSAEQPLPAFGEKAPA
ncbi:MAG: hypothetical protein D3917_17625 [Candidatus Electrothrix sp. AX5]|nr:hypothetical protein [Candidatus Electrothrix sp. AX5]